jgi:hypothetical protein
MRFASELALIFLPILLHLATLRTVMLRARQPALRSLRNGIPLLRSSALAPGRRTYASITDLGSYPKPGEKVLGFTLKRAQHVPELELTALHLEHDKTGADYLHIARDDSNNVFSIGFKTNPPDATGVPHILEHTTLCGSEKLVMCIHSANSTKFNTGIQCEIPSSRCSPGHCPIS